MVANRPGAFGAFLVPQQVQFSVFAAPRNPREGRDNASTLGYDPELIHIWTDTDGACVSPVSNVITNINVLSLI